MICEEEVVCECGAVLSAEEQSVYGGDRCRRCTWIIVPLSRWDASEKTDLEGTSPPREALTPFKCTRKCYPLF